MKNPLKIKDDEPSPIVHHPSSNALRLAAILGLLAMGAANVALAREDNLRVAPPDSKPHGKTYGQWSAAWYQWAYSLETIHHPLFDTADCSAGQSGDVWFLGGKFGPSGRLVRNCTIPENTALFFPILNSGFDNTDCPTPDNFTVAQLLGFLDQSWTQNVASVSCTIDGVAVRGLSDPIHTPYRVQSPPFTYTIPPVNNLVILFGYPCYTDTSATPSPIFVDANAVTDGVYIFLEPLSLGDHTLQFSGTGAGFSEDVTYHITVVRRNLQNPEVVRPNEKLYGLTYAQWSAKHWQWEFSLPSDHNPLADTADVSAGQSGNVWFLGGTFASTIENGVTVGRATRNVSIPEGKALFFPIIDAECSTIEGNGTNDAQLRSCAVFLQDHAHSLTCTVDAVAVHNLDDYRVQSRLFTFGPLPTNNILQAAAGSTSPSVSDGVFVMLKPLSRGYHQLHFTGALSLSKTNGDPFDLEFEEDITYNIWVDEDHLAPFSPKSRQDGKSLADWQEIYWRWAFGDAAHDKAKIGTDDNGNAVVDHTVLLAFPSTPGDGTPGQISRTLKADEAFVLPLWNLLGNSYADGTPPDPFVNLNVFTTLALKVQLDGQTIIDGSNQMQFFSQFSFIPPIPISPPTPANAWIWLQGIGIVHPPLRPGPHLITMDAKNTDTADLFGLTFEYHNTWNITVQPER